MTNQPSDVEELKLHALKGLEQVASAEELEVWRVQYIGRKGTVPQLLRRVKDLPASERKIVGQKANELRQELEDAYKEKQKTYPLDTISIGQQDKETISQKSVSRESVGHLHPITLTIRRVQNILSNMGFVIAEGPEVEQERYNFDLLNIPLEHSARGEMDTFHVKSKQEPLVLRTHTSPVQLRAVLEYNLTPPIRIASPGRVFRSENTDATHESTFHQFEGLVIDKEITISHFKGTIEHFYSTFFGKDAKARLRPSYFPFVEPGFEVDISCPFCDQKGCRVCKRSGWIEIMGAGMVHPNVLRNMNIDPSTYQGYAFGGAIDRLAMIRHNIPDIRLFWSGDIRFLKQFS